MRASVRFASDFGSLCVLTAVLVAGCGEADGTSFEWSVALGDAGSRTEIVVAEVRPGGCDGGVDPEPQVLRRGDRARSSRLAPGPYGLAARALDRSCQRIAAACVEVTLGARSVEPLIVTLASIAPEPECDIAECRHASCAPLPDAGRDAQAAIDGEAPRDASIRDAAVDLGPCDIDAGFLCGEMRCGPAGACEFATDCATSESQTMACTSYFCLDRVCTPIETPLSVTCDGGMTRVTDGVACAAEPGFCGGTTATCNMGFCIPRGCPSGRECCEDGTCRFECGIPP